MLRTINLTFFLLAFMLGLSGCDIIDLAEDRERRQFDFTAVVQVVLGDPPSSPVPDASIQFRAHKLDNKRKKIPGTDLFASKKTDKNGKCEWIFGYRLLYDKGDEKYLESVLLDVYANAGGLHGTSRDHMDPNSGDFYWNIQIVSIFVYPGEDRNPDS